MGAQVTGDALSASLYDVHIKIRAAPVLVPSLGSCYSLRAVAADPGARLSIGRVPFLLCRTADPA